MSNHIIFGDKNEFAIELMPMENKSNGLLRIWIKNKTIGNFKRNGEFIFAIRNLKKYFFNKERLFEPIFEEMTPRELIDYFIPWDLANSKDSNDWAEANRRSIYTRFLGDQLDPISIFSYWHNDELTLIFYDYKNKKQPIKIFKLNSNKVESVFKEFISWYENLFGEVKFNPEVFP